MRTDQKLVLLEVLVCRFASVEEGERHPDQQRDRGQGYCKPVEPRVTRCEVLIPCPAQKIGILSIFAAHSWFFRSRFGSFAILLAMRRASSIVSTFAVAGIDIGQGHPRRLRR